MLLFLYCVIALPIYLSTDVPTPTSRSTNNAQVGMGIAGSHLIQRFLMTSKLIRSIRVKRNVTCDLVHVNKIKGDTLYPYQKPDC